jgi:hypothetical protein
MIHIAPGSRPGAKVRRASFAWNRHGVPLNRAPVCALLDDLFQGVVAWRVVIG